MKTLLILMIASIAFVPSNVDAQKDLTPIKIAYAAPTVDNVLIAIAESQGAGRGPQRLPVVDIEVDPGFRGAIRHGVIDGDRAEAAASAGDRDIEKPRKCGGQRCGVWVEGKVGC